MIERMKAVKKFERETEDTNLNKVLDQFGVQYTGNGPRELVNEVDTITSPESDDPLNGLGFGFEAYWRMLWSMSAVFILLSLIFLPEIIINVSVGGMKGVRNYANSEFTLGNLGFSASNCIFQYNGINHARDLTCLVGTIDSSVAFGLIPDTDYSDDTGFNMANYADGSNNYYSFCGVSDS